MLTIVFEYVIIRVTKRERGETKMKDKIKIARERVKMMESELKRLEAKYTETNDELYREMADSTSRQINETIIAIIEAERNL